MSFEHRLRIKFIPGFFVNISWQLWPNMTIRNSSVSLLIWLNKLICSKPQKSSLFFNNFVRIFSGKITRQCCELNSTLTSWLFKCSLLLSYAIFWCKAHLFYTNKKLTEFAIYFWIVPRHNIFNKKWTTNGQGQKNQLKNQ